MPKRIPRKLYAIMSDPHKVPWIILGLCVALLIAIGFDAILYSRSNAVSGQVRSIKQAKAISDQSALEQCRQTIPSRTKFIKEIIRGYNLDADVAKQARDLTPKHTMLYGIRNTSYHIKLDIANQLGKSLPISCIQKPIKKSSVPNTRPSR